MKQRRFYLGVAVSLLAVSVNAAVTPVAPGDLGAEVNGMSVTLSWEWGNAGRQVHFNSFEDMTTFSAPWSVQGEAKEPEMSSWMIYTFEDPESEYYAHTGENAAVLPIGMDYENPEDCHQDESLRVKPGVGAVYLDFWYYIHPSLLENGGYEDFPDHYYVNISRDGGQTWNELWDARWDMGPEDAVQLASLFLGEPTDENTVIEFEGISHPEASLYYTWIIDDVEFLAADGSSAKPVVKLTKNQRNDRVASTLNGRPTHREFTSKKSRTKAKAEEWLNGGNITFRVYLDDNKIGDYIKTRNWSDYSDKTAGSHTYKVCAWSEALDQEYASASVSVDIDEFTFDPVKSLSGTVQEKNGKYTVEVKWEAPENAHPVFYTVYANDRMIARVESGDELGAGQTGLYKGVYEMSVEANYEHPTGASERKSITLAAGTVLPPVNFKASLNGNDVDLSWDVPETKPISYTLYRGDEVVMENSDAYSFHDANVKEGSYVYSIHANYAEEVSLPAQTTVTLGDKYTAELPVKADFNNGHLPANWEVDLVDPYERVKDMYAWRFDNWFDMEIPSDAGLSGCFASVSSVAAGMNRLQSYVISPVVKLGSDGYVRFNNYFNETTPGPSGAAQYILEICDIDDVDVIENEDGEEVTNYFWNELCNLRDAGSDVNINLSSYAGKNVRIRWSFLGRNSGEAAFDNVVISDTSLGIGLPVIDESASYDVYSPAGICIGRNVSADMVNDLPKGIYILKAGGKSVKIVK